MGWGRDDGQGFLGEFEHMVLLAILQAGNEAYAVRILEELDSRAGRRTDRGALYKTLDRLEAKGLLDWTVEPGTPAPGGHRRRVFTVRPEGLEAVRVAHIVSAEEDAVVGQDDASMPDATSSCAIRILGRYLRRCLRSWRCLRVHRQSPVVELPNRF